MVRVLVTTLVLIAAGFFTVSNASTLGLAAAGLRSASLGPVAAGVLFSILAIINRGFLNRAAHAAVGLHTRPIPMARTAAVGFAANKVVKTAGASGLAVFVRHGDRRGHAGPSVAAACIIAAGASFVALGLLVATNIVVLAGSNRLSGWWLTAGVCFLAYAGAIVGAGAMARRRRQTAVRIWIGVRNRFARLLRRPVKPDPVGIDELFDAMAAARTNGSWTGRVVMHAIVSKLLGAAMLLAAAEAIGLPVSVATALLIYTSVLVAALFSIVPGGLGMVEATAAALFVSAGAPLALAVAAVALFRIFDLWIPVAAGAIAGRNEFKQLSA